MMEIPRLARMIAVIIGLASLPVVQAAAQEPGSPAQKRACRPDVYRLCAAEIPKVQAIVRCLKLNVSRLSPDCRAVFETGLQ